MEYRGVTGNPCRKIMENRVFWGDIGIQVIYIYIYNQLMGSKNFIRI